MVDVEWKEELYGIDFINALEKERVDVIIGNIRLMLVAMKTPKLTYEELLALPINDFMELYIGFKEKYKESLFKGASALKIPKKLKKPGIQFVKEEDYIKENEIQFSEVVKENG